MNFLDDFYNSRRINIEKLTKSEEVKEASIKWMDLIADFKYAYNFDWLGRPAIQFPNDAWALQEIIWDTKPDIIIETGIAHGGSLILNASLMALLDLCEYLVKPSKELIPKRKVIGIDIDIRDYNRKKILEHPLSPYITLLQGSSTDEAIFEETRSLIEDNKRVMVLLDSNHEYSHVSKELNFYSQLVSVGNYIIVYDTAIDLQKESLSQDRPWKEGNGPLRAVHEFLEINKKSFKCDESISGKLGITVAPFGFIRKLS